MKISPKSRVDKFKAAGKEAGMVSPAVLEAQLAYHFSAVLEYPHAKPKWVYISLSHKCTYQCRMCGVVKILKGHELSTALAQKALDEIALWRNGCSVVFTGGEPFLRPDIFDLFRYGTQRGITVEAVSNGACINEAYARKIMESGIANIAVSLDGASAAVHDAVRREGSFAKAVEAIRWLSRAKRALGRGPQLSVWTTIMKENVHELFDLTGLAGKLGVECLVYHPVIAAQDDMQNTYSNAPFWIPGEQLPVLREQLDRIVAEKRENGRVAFLHDPYLWLRYFAGTLTRQDWRCNPFVFLSIGPDAEIRSCGAAFGNLRDMSIAECLETPAAFAARRLMRQCEKPCLQTCWALPEADFLPEIIGALIRRAGAAGLDAAEQKKCFSEAYKLLEHYETLVRERIHEPA